MRPASRARLFATSSSFSITPRLTIIKLRGKLNTSYSSKHHPNKRARRKLDSTKEGSMGQPQGATSDGTAAYRDRFRGITAEGHFRQSQGLWMSSVGLGSYLGHHDERTDEAY